MPFIVKQNQDCTIFIQIQTTLKKRLNVPLANIFSTSLVFLYSGKLRTLFYLTC